MNERKSNVKKNSDERVRNWTFIIYPDSAPQNWRDIISNEHIQWIESPLHDADENADGEQKKPHWHVLLLYAGKKSFEQIKDITDSLNSPHPQKVASTKGLVRYMVHMDNPEKKQYDKSLIIGYGGADVAEYLKPTSSSRYQLIREMMDFVKENNIFELRVLLDYSMKERFDDWFPLLCDNSAYIMGEYIKSFRHSSQINKISKIDSETGEVMT
ncbi:MAG: replication protein [Bacteroidetes bacterium]|nr:replication protein [Bacteroidota bacterium]